MKFTATAVLVVVCWNGKVGSVEYFTHIIVNNIALDCVFVILLMHSLYTIYHDNQYISPYTILQSHFISTACYTHVDVL